MKHVILVCTLATGMAWAQSPQVVQNVRNSLNTVQKKATAASNAALGTQPATATAKASPAPTKSAPGSSQLKVVPAKKAAATAKAPAPAPEHNQASAKPRLAVKAVAVTPVAAKKEAKRATAPKKAEAAPKPAAPAPEASASENSAGQSEEAKADESTDDDKQDKKWSMAGKRDPFISPVVNHTGGSGCSTGKKCLEIGAINLRGVVRSDAGFIAVVTNSLNKAYFLRENDPVFDGYVVKITGDSIVFKETLQDRLGKTFTREVVKKIATPAV